MAESDGQKQYRELVEHMERLEQRLAKLEQRIGTIPPPLPVRQMPATQPPQQLRPQEPAPPAAPAAVAAPGIPATAPPTHHENQPIKAKPTLSLEEWIGMRGFLVIAAVLVLISAVWFFQYALAQGWITPLHHVIAGAIGGLVMIGIGELAFRKQLAYFAAGLFGIGVVLLYFTVWVASPNGFYADFDILNMQTAFILMCCVTVLGVFLSARSGFRLSAIISLIGAVATPAMLSTGENHFVELMSYLMAVNIAFCVLAAIKRWGDLTLIALVGTVVLTSLWGAEHLNKAAKDIVIIMTAAHFVIFYGYAFIASHLKRTHDFFGIALIATGGSLLACLWCDYFNLSLTTFMMLTLSLLLAVYVICFARRWNWLGYGAAIWTVLSLWGYYDDQHQHFTAIAFAALFWGLYAAVLGEMLIRCWLKWTRKQEAIDAGFIAAATGLMFLVTYELLRRDYMPWMGLYTASLGAASILLMWILRRFAGRRIMAYSFLGVGLVLITVAIPIHFDKSSVTIAWAIQGVVAAFLARRLKSKMLLTKVPIVLMLSLIHYLHQELPKDPWMQEIAVTLFGMGISWAMLLAIAISTAFLFAAVILSWRKSTWSKQYEQNIPYMSCIMAGIAVILYLSMTGFELPRGNSLWWWFAPAIAVWAIGLWRRWATVTAFGLVMLVAVAARWVFYDTLTTIVAENFATGSPALELLVNWVAPAGLLSGIAMMASLPLIRKKFPLWPGDIAVILWIIGVLLLIWTGNHEIDLYFNSSAIESFKNPALACQMSISIWWAVCATAILVAGFVKQMPSARYLAIVIFAITLCKVFIADMQGVLAVYKILSFMGLGILMLTGSWLYHRYFRKTLAAEPANQSPEDK